MPHPIARTLAYAWFVVALLFATGCKKNDRGSEQKQCPPSGTFVKDITANIPAGVSILSIHEDIKGGIHVETNDHGTWKVLQFEANGSFVGSNNLGVYSTYNKLTVQDAYYTATFFENESDINVNQVLRGWKETYRYNYSQSTGVCGPYFQQDSLNPYSSIATEGTTINKIDFTGIQLWTATFDGYWPTTTSPILFTNNGDLFLTALNYTGADFLLRILGRDYEWNDPNRPNFQLTDTMLLKDIPQQFVLTKINSTNGAIISGSKHTLNYFENMNTEFSSAFTSNSIYIHYGEIAYQFDMNCKYQGDVHLVMNECFPKHFIRSLYSSTDNKLFVQGGISGVSLYTAKTDLNNNTLWQLQKNGYLVPVSNGGFVFTDLSSSYQLFDAGGNAGSTFTFQSYIRSANLGNSFSPTEAHSCASCNGDLLHIVNAYNPNPNSAATTYFLIRCKANGQL